MESVRTGRNHRRNRRLDDKEHRRCNRRWPPSPVALELAGIGHMTCDRASSIVTRARTAEPLQQAIVRREAKRSAGGVRLSSFPDRRSLFEESGYAFGGVFCEGDSRQAYMEMVEGRVKIHSLHGVERRLPNRQSSW